MKILVLGGAGYIGSHTVYELIDAGEEGRRAGDPAVLIASSEKAKNILGWKPEHADLEEIIASAWKWHSSHPQGYCSVQK